jgi:hypothetical protein
LERGVVRNMYKVRRNVMSRRIGGVLESDEGDDD